MKLFFVQRRSEAPVLLKVEGMAHARHYAMRDVVCRQATKQDLVDCAMAGVQPIDYLPSGEFQYDLIDDGDAGSGYAPEPGEGSCGAAEPAPSPRSRRRLKSNAPHKPRSEAESA